MSPEDVIEVIDAIEPYLAVHTEAQLADYGETANGGPYVKLRLNDATELDPFRGQDRAAKNKAGKRYILMLVEVADDEKPVDQHKAQQAERVKGGPRSKRAARLCLEVDFASFVSASSPTFRKAHAHLSDTEFCRQYILETCRIDSRAQLDHNDRAAHLFEKSVIGPYMQWLVDTGRAAA